MGANLLIRAAAGLAGWRAHRNLVQFRRGLSDAVRLQDRVLADHVAASARSRLGIDFGLGQVKSYQDFAGRLPIMTYDDLAPYIEPIKTGDVESLLNPGTRVHMFALTSGTTGSAKYIPVTDRTLADYRRGWNAWGIAVYDDYPKAWLRSIFQMPSSMSEQRTADGTPCGSITGFIHQSQMSVVKKFYACPDCIAEISDPEAKYYAAMRFAITRDVGMVAMPNPSTTLRLVKTADRHAQTLIRDVRDGTLSDAMDIEPDIRRELEQAARPDPALAGRLDAAAAKRGSLRPMDYWDVGVLANWTGGTVGLYISEFPEWFGDAPVRDLGLVASEGRMTVPLTSQTAAGVLEVFGNFYEFVPVGQINAGAPDVLRCHELVEGEEYFILLTTGGGLFRYNIGDVVRCEGYLGQAPLLTFLSKGKHTSSITGEKLTEHQVVRAAERAAGRLGRHLRDFVLAPRWDDPPYYALNVEEGCCPPEAADEMARAIDAELSDANIEYQQKRHSGRLGPIVVACVCDGYFGQLAEEHVRDRGGRREQYKHQFLYTSVDADAEFPRPAGRPSRAGR